jgi:hypothetical protein
MGKFGVHIPLFGAPGCYENRSSKKGSPSLSTRSWSAWEFLQELGLFPASIEVALPVIPTEVVLESGLYNSTGIESSIEMDLAPLLDFSLSPQYLN